MKHCPIRCRWEKALTRRRATAPWNGCKIGLESVGGHPNFLIFFCFNIAVVNYQTLFYYFFLYDGVKFSLTLETLFHFCGPRPGAGSEPKPIEPLFQENPRTLSEWERRTVVLGRRPQWEEEAESNGQTQRGESIERNGQRKKWGAHASSHPQVREFFL